MGTELDVENWRMLLVVAAMTAMGQEQCLVWTGPRAALYSRAVAGLGRWPLKSKPKPQPCNLLLYQPPRAWGPGWTC